jgi:hypothetical protein
MGTILEKTTLWRGLLKKFSSYSLTFNQVRASLKYFITTSISPFSVLIYLY